MDILITRNTGKYLPYITVSVRQKDEPYMCSMYADRIEIENDMIYGFIGYNLTFGISLYGNELFIKYTC